MLKIKIKKVDNLNKNINERNGVNKIINKDKGKEIKDLKTKFDSETGNEFYLLKNKDNKENENNKTIIEQEIICIKDPKNNKDILIDKKINKILDDLELKKNENGDIYIINKSTGEELKNIKRKINPKTNEEIFIKPIEINNNELYITSIKDNLTKKEILINKNTGEKLDNFEIKTNPKTRKSVIINKKTGDIVNDIKWKIESEAEEEIFIKENNNNNLEIISEIDPISEKEILINKETGEK